MRTSETEVAYFNVLQSCGHKNKFRSPAPEKGAVLYCFKCCHWKTVRKVKRGRAPKYV